MLFAAVDASVRGMSDGCAAFCAAPQSRTACAVIAAGKHDQDVTSAEFMDPDGVSVTALHLFRRNPLVSLTVACPASAMTACDDFYGHILGLRRMHTHSDVSPRRQHRNDPAVSPRDLLDLHLPLAPRDPFVYVCGATYNTTALVVRRDEGGSNSVRSSSAATAGGQIIVHVDDIDSVAARLRESFPSTPLMQPRPGVYAATDPAGTSVLIMPNSDNGS